MPRERMNLTPLRLVVLTRIHSAGRPLRTAEALGDRPGSANILPQLQRIGWVRFKQVDDGQGFGYVLTDEGRRVAGLD